MDILKSKLTIFEFNKNSIGSGRSLSNELELIRLFQNLKDKYNEHFEIFNKLKELKLTDGTDVLKMEDKLKMIKNNQTILSLLAKHSEVIPNYHLDLTDLQEINISRPTSPELENLNTEAQSF
jgi:hypothetical protein